MTECNPLQGSAVLPHAGEWWLPQRRAEMPSILPDLRRYSLALLLLVGNNHVATLLLQGKYDASKHPDVVTKRRSREDVMEEFVSTLEEEVKEGKVRWCCHPCRFLCHLGCSQGRSSAHLATGGECSPAGGIVPP